MEAKKRNRDLGLTACLNGIWKSNVTFCHVERSRDSLVFGKIVEILCARNDRLSEFIEYYANKADAKLPNGAKRR